MGTISVAALWQIAYAPYVSDYSRYMPRATGSRPAFWASYTGCSIGSILPMILGAIVGLAVTGGDVVQGLTTLTSGISVLVVVVFSIGIAATNAMNLYCGTLSTLTVGQTLVPRFSPRARSRALIALLLFGVSLILALVAQNNFLVNYENFISLLLYVLVPWTAVNLVDYYLVQHGDYAVDDFFRADGGTLRPGQLGRDRVLRARHRHPGAVHRHDALHRPGRIGAARRGPFLDRRPLRRLPRLLPGGQAVPLRPRAREPVRLAWWRPGRPRTPDDRGR